MTKPSLTRAAFIAGVLAVSAIAAAPQAYASRNGDAEQYVQTNAADVLAHLADREPSAQRRQTSSSCRNPMDAPSRAVVRLSP